MMTRTIRTIAGITLVLAAVALTASDLQAQNGKKPSADVGGKWIMDAETPHGRMQMSLTLDQDGSKVTGTFWSDHGGEMAVSGEFAEGTLSLATVKTSDDHALRFSAKLNEDGTLSGYLSTPRGDMPWTAERAKDK